MNGNVNYSKLILSIDSKNKNSTKTSTKENTDKYKFIDYKIHTNIIKKDKFISRNQVPKNNKWISYETWEHIYFDNIIDISKLFLDSFSELDLNIQNKAHFIDTIGHFLFNCSSGEIIKSYELKNNDIYNKFTIKRQKLYNKNGKKDS